jgi:alpha-glucosidase (family GH31 glycosyl hydrolase)
VTKIPKYTLATQTQASQAFNTAYNDAVRSTKAGLNSGTVAGDENSVAKYLKAQIIANLQAINSGEVFNTGGFCTGSIPVNEIGDNSWCWGT